MRYPIEEDELEDGVESHGRADGDNRRRRAGPDARATTPPSPPATTTKIQKELRFLRHLRELLTRYSNWGEGRAGTTERAAQFVSRSHPGSSSARAPASPSSRAPAPPIGPRLRLGAAGIEADVPLGEEHLLPRRAPLPLITSRSSQARRLPHATRRRNEQVRIDRAPSSTRRLARAIGLAESTLVEGETQHAHYLSP